jgi:hypothetical protein
VVRAGRCCKEPEVGYTIDSEASLAGCCRVNDPAVWMGLSELICLLMCGWLFAVVVVVWRGKSPLASYQIYENAVQSESPRKYRVNGLTVNKCLLASSICVTSRPVRAIFTSSSHT